MKWILAIVFAVLAQASTAQTTTAPYNEPRVHPEASQLFYDAFETGFDTTNRWNAATSSGGGVGEAWSAGQITLGTGTTANGYSFVQTQYSFPPNPPGWLESFFAIKLPAAVPSNAYAFWGTGTIPGSPTAAAPLTDACGFEMQTSGKLFIACYASGARQIIQDLSTASGSGKQPTDGTTHSYYQFFRGDYMWWAIDNPTNVVASRATGVNGPDVNTMPIAIEAVAGSTAPTSSLTITVAAVWAGATNSISTAISDGANPWRRAAVSAAGALSTSGTISGTTSNASSGIATSATNIPTVSYNYAFNGTTWDQIRSKPASTAPLATDPALVVSLGPNSSGLITTGTAGSPASQVVTVQGIASGTGLNFASQYPASAVAITGNGTGTTGAVVGTLAASASIKTYICGFNVSATGGVATLGPIVVAGLVGSSQTYQLFSTATGAQLSQTFTPCIPSSAINTAITITTTADATASAVDVNSWGYQL